MSLSETLREQISEAVVAALEDGATGGEVLDEVEYLIGALANGS